MENEQEPDDGDVQFSAAQLELIKEATSPPRPKTAQEAALIASRDAELRRAVYDAIVQLSEVVSENALRVLLPFLHCNAWDEIVEERYLGNPRLCGFPLCGEVVEARMKKQRYHIDRVACKIYEHRIETDMYCSRSCLLRSASVRAQLPDEPLWLAGNISKRINATYRIDGPEMGGHEKKNEIEIVRAVDEKLSELKVREGDSSTESEREDNEEDEKDVRGFLEEMADILGVNELEKCEPRSDDLTPKTTPKSGSNPKMQLSPKSLNKTSTPTTPTGNTLRKSSESHYNPRLPDPQISADKVVFTKNELQKLERLRTKYSTYRKKKPIIVDPVPASPSSSKDEGEDAAVIDAAKPSLKTAPTTSRVEPRFVEDVRILFRNWVTDRTRQLLRSGGLSISSETDSIMKKFFCLYSDDVAEVNDFVMPSVDSIDVKKRRLHIFLDSVKKQMTAYQRELDVTSSEVNMLYMIAATFDLEPNTITNFPNKVLKLVCASLLKLISMLDTSVEDTIFPQGTVSEKFVRLLGNIDVDMKVFDSIISEIVERNAEKKKGFEARAKCISRRAAGNLYQLQKSFAGGPSKIQIKLEDTSLEEYKRVKLRYAIETYDLKQAT